MKPLLTLIAMLPAGAAMAHPGHLVEAAGHNHWIGLAALGAAIAVTGWALLKGRKKSDADAEAEPEDTPGEEASQEA